MSFLYILTQFLFAGFRYVFVLPIVLPAVSLGLEGVSTVFLPCLLCVILHVFLCCLSLCSFFVAYYTFFYAFGMRIAVLCDVSLVSFCLVIRIFCSFLSFCCVVLVLKFKNSFVCVCHIENNAYLCIVVKRRCFTLIYTAMVLGLFFTVVLTFSVARICVEAKDLKGNY